jgi:hypothetical protein
MIFALVGYGLAAALFAVLSITSWRGRGAGGLFAAACGVTALWVGLRAT